MRHRAVAPVWLFLLGLGWGLGAGGAPASPPAGGVEGSKAALVQPDRVVFLASGLADEELITFTTAIAASGHPGVVLLDTPRTSPRIKEFLVAFRPEQVIPVGRFPAGVADLERRLGLKTAPALPWERGPPVALWQALFPRAERVVVCPAAPRGLLLQAACLAGALRAPLFVARGEGSHDAPELRARLSEWRTRKVFAAGAADRLCRDLPGVRSIALADEEAVAAAYLPPLCQGGPVRTLVVANAADVLSGRGGMSSLAPWMAVQRRAALLLTNDRGDNAATVIRDALKQPGLQQADVLILVASLQAIPPEQRPNPIPGKDAHIEMEPMTPAGPEPFTFATGRLFHQDPAVVALMLARARLLPPGPSRRQALVVSNPGGGLPLLETFSRNTVQELRNQGYRTTALFGKEANKEDVRRLLPDQHLFLWEGHHKTLVEDYGLPSWTEPLSPALIFLQSCLALNEAETRSLLERGAVGIVGPATRTYSASGGAFTLAFFDGLLYDDQTLGGALRQAKNFLLAYTLLKEKRLGPSARLSGANVRSSWAFTLWGDPTLKLSPALRPEDHLPPVRHRVEKATLVVSMPVQAYEKVTTTKYTAQMFPNTRLAGLLTKDLGEDQRRLVPFVFLEVPLPEAPPGKTPRLRSRIPGKHWVFCWDGRRRSGYLLVTPRPSEQKELHFRIEWED